MLLVDQVRVYVLGTILEIGEVKTAAFGTDILLD